MFAPARSTASLGPNGAGKTTTIQMLLNLTRPTSGRIMLFGEPLEPGAFEYKRWLGVVAEEPFEFSQMTGWELIRYFVGLYDVALPAGRIEELFRALDLWDVRHGHNPRLLARHAPEAEHYSRAGPRAQAADPRRAGQRARPARHPPGCAS